MNIRRTIGFIITVGLIGRLSYELAWQPDLRDRLLESPWQSVTLFALALGTIGFVLWSIFAPNGWRTLITFGLGIATALWAQDLLQGISWAQLGILCGIVFGLVALWFITTWDEIFDT